MTTRKGFGAGIAGLLAVLMIVPGTFAQLPRAAVSVKSSSADSRSAAALPQQETQSADAVKQLEMKLKAMAATSQVFEFNTWEFETRFGDKPVKGAPL